MSPSAPSAAISAADSAAAAEHHHLHQQQQQQQQHSPLPRWHFPFGPSSRFHEREQPARGQHTRFNSSYTPTAPVLSTARRAHRRAYTNDSGFSSSAPSPPKVEYSRSPLSRYSSYTSTMSIHRSASGHPAPTTPAKNSRRDSSLQQSPFSDYFTDDARSSDEGNAQSTTETKRLLVRMNKLQSQLMRDQSAVGRDAIRMVGNRLNVLERDLALLYTQSRLPFHVDNIHDSGLFVEEENEDKDGEGEKIEARSASTSRQALHDPYLPGTADASMELPPEPVTLEQYKAERDWFVLHMQDALERLRTAQSELARRCVEVRETNAYHAAQIEEHETQLEQLRSENEGLRSDLGFEYSELLFLKLQMKSLEVDADAVTEREDSERPQTAAVVAARRAKKNRILSEMDRWRSDWQDVYERFRNRRSKYGVSSARHDSASPVRDIPGSGDGVEWHLETVKEGRGRVTSLTIRRMDSNYDSVALDTPRARTHNQDDEPSHTSTSTASDRTAKLHLLASSQQPTRLYFERGTQTDPILLQQPHARLGHDPQPMILRDQQLSADTLPANVHDDFDADCAITTSSEASDFDAEEDDDDDDDDDGPRADALHAVRQEQERERERQRQLLFLSQPSRTAWQELWDSLANLSGMGDDRFD